MKRTLLLGLGIFTAASLMAGCSSNLKQTQGAAAPTAAAAEASEAQAPGGAVAETTAAAAAGDELLTGFASITTINSSKDVAADAQGLAQADSTVVALTLDSTGKITDCIIDGVQTKIDISKEGKVTTDLKTTFEPKSILGDKYGMKTASKIGKEWNEEADALAKYVIGKTPEEVKGIAVTSEGAPADADLAASVTFKISGCIDAIEKAAANAQNLGAKSGDKLGLAMATNIAKSTDAAADAEGAAQAYTTYTALTLGSDSKITSCILDATQTIINFDKTGKITSDLKTPIQTKDELKEAYGMKKASKLGLEWYQEADNFAKYAVGKTADEITGLAIDQTEGAPADADLAASVTIGIGDFQNVIKQAASTAR